MILPEVVSGETAWERERRKIWTTRGARLETYRRLRRAGRASGWAISLASLFLIGLSLAVGFGLLDFGSQTDMFAQFLTALGAIGILVVSSKERSESYELRADRHHRVAKELGKLYDLASTWEEQDAEQLTLDYAQVLDRFDENHETRDYHMFAVRHPDDFRFNWWDSLKTWVVWNASAQMGWVIVAAVLLSGLFVGVFLTT